MGIPHFFFFYFYLQNRYILLATGKLFIHQFDIFRIESNNEII